jgi:predicted kinase
MGVQGIVIEPARAYRRHLQLCQTLLNRAVEKAGEDSIVTARLQNWRTLLNYLQLEVQAKAMTEVLSSVSPYGQLLARINQIYRQMNQLIQSNRDKGLFLLEDRRLNYSAE